MAQARLITGPARSAREAEVDALIREHWGRSLLILPTQRLIQPRIQQLLREAEPPGLWGEPVLAFDRFVANILAASGEHPALAGDAERRLILARAVHRLRAAGALESLGAASQTEGFLSHLLRVIESLKQAAIDPADFRVKVQKRRHPGEMDAIVAAVYKGYQKELQNQGLYDRIGVYWRAEVICRESTPQFLQSIKLVAFDGFDDFTPSEFRVLEALSAHTDQLVFGINYDPDPARSDLFQVQQRTVNALRRQFEPVLAEHGCLPPASFVDHAAQHLLTRDPPPPVNGLTPNLEVVPCSDSVQEVEYVGRRIKRLLVENQADPQAIAVVYRDLQNIGPALKAAYGEFGIPFQLDQHLPLNQSACCSLLATLLEGGPEWPAETVLDLVVSPWLPAANPVGLQASPLLMRLSGVIEGFQDWHNGVARLSLHLDEKDSRLAEHLRRIEEPKGAIDALDARIAQLEQLIDFLPSTGTAGEFAEALDQLVDASGMPAEQPGAGDAAFDMEKEAVAQLRVLLGRIHRWYAGDGTRYRPAEFSSLLRGLMAAETITLRGTRGGVQVLDVQRVRQLRYDHVFFCGVNEGDIPRPPAANAIYNQRDVEDLAEAGVAIESARDRSNRELVWFHHALCAAEKYLCITYRSVDAAGRGMRKSPLLIDMLRLFGEVALTGAMPPVDCFIPSPDDVASWRDLRNAAMLRSSSLVELFADGMNPERQGAAIEAQRYDFQPFGPYDGRIEHPDARQWLADRLGKNHVYSVGQIETFLTCPFQFLTARVFGIEPVDMPEEAFDALERGRIVHEVLQRFHAQFRARALTDIPPDEAEEALQTGLRGVFENRMRVASGPMRGILVAEKARMARTLTRYLRHEREAQETEKQAPWKPIEFEVSFGDVRGERTSSLSKPEPLPLALEGHTVQFSGRIDRIDELDGAYRIVDYKTGKAPSFKEQETGRSVQLPLYAMALEQHLIAGAACREARFIEVGNKPKRDVLTRDKAGKWEQCLAKAKESVEKVLNRIRSGEFVPLPEKQACRFCGRTRPCRYEEGRISRKPELP